MYYLFCLIFLYAASTANTLYGFNSYAYTSLSRFLIFLRLLGDGMFRSSLTLLPRNVIVFFGSFTLIFAGCSVSPSSFFKKSLIGSINFNSSVLFSPTM